MKEVNLITIGHLKDKSIILLENNYLKQIKSFKFKIHELKSLSENVNAEATQIVKKIDQITSGNLPRIILLTENGKQFDSIKFSSWLYNHIEGTSKHIIFVIGGAAGFGEEILKKASERISLSPLTFPHKLARLILIEQIYRAGTIKTNHPYHK